MNIKCRCWPCLHSLSFLLHGLVPSGHIFIDFHCCWFLWWLTKCLHNHCGILGFSHIWLHIGEMLREWGNKSKNLVSIMYSTVISLRPQNNPVLAVMYLHSDTAWQFLLCFFWGGGGAKGVVVPGSQGRVCQTCSVKQRSIPSGRLSEPNTTQMLSQRHTVTLAERLNTDSKSAVKSYLAMASFCCGYLKAFFMCEWNAACWPRGLSVTSLFLKFLSQTQSYIFKVFPI